jgi:pSer/pThr/pTyr-binding forkhead associated (FHA) protein
MRTVTFIVLEGVDKGRVFRDLPIPVTIGREEGNVLRLNDERVSRYHAKIQIEDTDVIVTDLDSTNGTRVNGATVQIRRLRPGDQLSIGRTMLLFGTMDEISLRRSNPNGLTRRDRDSNGTRTIKTDELAAAAAAVREEEEEVENQEQAVWSARDKDVPPLPQKLSGSQSARLSEIFDYLHRGLSMSLENISANEDCTEVTVGFNEWQTILAIQALLAKYSRSVAEPEI